MLNNSDEIYYLTFKIMKKLRLTMRLLAIFCLVCALNANALPGRAQQTEVQLNVRNSQLTEVLKQVQQQSGYNIIYSNDLLPV